MASTIIHKKSSVAEKVPLSTDLEVGEIAINLADKYLYTKNAAGEVILVGGGTWADGNVGFEVKNQTGATIPKGTVVGFAGTVGASGRLLVAPFLANGSQPSDYVVGIVTTDLVDGADGLAIDHGKLRGVDTSAFTAGTILYASSTVAGGLTSTVPAAPNNKITVAAVVLSDPTNGTLEIRVTPGSSIANDELVELNAVANGETLVWNSTTGRFENNTVSSGASTLADLTDVTITSPTTGQVLKYNGTAWVNDTDATGAGGGSSVTVSDTAPESPSAGDLWYDSNDNTLSVYYQDIDSSQWVVASGPMGPEGPVYSVYQGTTAPLDPVNGDLWFNTNDASMYFYFDDGDSTQWVAISGPTGPAGASGVTTGKAIAMAIVFG
jgi:hypothetical protein